MQFEGITLERVLYGFGSLALGFCPLTLLHSGRENCVTCQKFSLKYSRKFESLVLYSIDHAAAALATGKDNLVLTWY